MEPVNDVYIYRPLIGQGALRLIELQPSSDLAARPKCTVFHTTLQALNDEVVYHYCALSYVWGSSTDNRIIELDGKEVQVTVNLATALAHLRHSSKPFYLWADAICINQKDDEEKSIQVSQMGEVYKAARHTIIWLGEATIGGDEIFNSIRDAKNQTQAWEMLKRENDLGVPDMSEGSDFSDESEMLTEDGGLDVQSLRDLVDLPWFTRVWIYQELIFSPDPWLQCGRSRIRWEDLSTVISSLSSGDKLSDSFQRFLAMDKAKREFRSQGEHHNARSRVLLDTLLCRRGLGVFDHRDMIFAHLGIVENSSLDGTPEDWAVLGADYSKHCSDLYIDVAKYLSSKIDIFELMSHVEADSDDRYPKTPSWLPNWTVKPLPTQYQRLNGSVSNLRRQYEEYYGLQLEDRLTNSDSSLLLREQPESYKHWLSPLIIFFLGFRMGTVTRISPIIRRQHSLLSAEAFRATELDGENDIPQEIYHAWKNIFSTLVEHENEFGTLLQVAIEKFRSLPSPELAIFADDLLIHVLLHLTRPTKIPYPRFLYGRRLALIAGCGLAVVPCSAKVGDVAALFLERTTIPFLLRPKAPVGNDKFNSKLDEVFKLRAPVGRLEVNEFEFIGECILQDYLFSSLDSRYFANLNGNSYPGTLEGFTIH